MAARKIRGRNAVLNNPCGGADRAAMERKVEAQLAEALREGDVELAEVGGEGVWGGAREGTGSGGGEEVCPG